MSTFNKLDPRAKLGKEKRRDALRFFRQQMRLPGAPGVVARILYTALDKVHKDSTLNGPEKEAAFRAILANRTAERVPAVPGVPPVGSVGGVPPVAGPAEPAA